MHTCPTPRARSARRASRSPRTTCPSSQYRPGRSRAGGSLRRASRRPIKTRGGNIGHCHGARAQDWATRGCGRPRVLRPVACGRPAPTRNSVTRPPAGTVPRPVRNFVISCFRGLTQVKPQGPTSRTLRPNPVRCHVRSRSRQSSDPLAAIRSTAAVQTRHD